MNTGGRAVKKHTRDRGKHAISRRKCGPVVRRNAKPSLVPAAGTSFILILILLRHALLPQLSQVWGGLGGYLVDVAIGIACPCIAYVCIRMLRARQNRSDPYLDVWREAIAARDPGPVLANSVAEDSPARTAGGWCIK